MPMEQAEVALTLTNTFICLKRPLLKALFNYASTLVSTGVRKKNISKKNL